MRRSKTKIKDEPPHGEEVEAITCRKQDDGSAQNDDQEIKTRREDADENP